MKESARPVMYHCASLDHIAASNFLAFSLSNYGLTFCDSDAFAAYQAGLVFREAINETIETSSYYDYRVGAHVISHWRDLDNDYEEDIVITYAPCWLPDGSNVAEKLNRLYIDDKSILGFAERNILSELEYISYDTLSKVYTFESDEGEFSLKFEDGEPVII